MNYVQWLKNWDSGPSGTYLVKVEEIYLRDQMRAVIKESIPVCDLNFCALNFRQMTKEEFETAVETLPVMSDKRFVFLQDVPLRRDDVKSYDEKLLWLLDYVKAQNPSTLLYLFFNGTKPFKGSRVKELAKYWQEVELFAADSTMLRSFIAKSLKRDALEAQNGLVDLIIRSSGYLDKNRERNLYDVENLVNKVKGTARDGRILLSDARDVLMVSYDENIFLLMDALTKRDLVIALRTLRGYEKELVDPFSVFYMIVRQVRNLLAIRCGVNRESLGLSTFEYGKLKNGVYRYSSKHLMRCHEALYEVEWQMKTGMKDLYFALERFLVQMCQGE